MEKVIVKYTYFRLDFIGFNWNDGDYTICENLTEVGKVLSDCEADLDVDENNKIEIKAIGMTRIEYNLWVNSLDPIEL